MSARLAATCHDLAVPPRDHQLTTITIADDPRGWIDAGFTITDGVTRIADTAVVLAGGAERGIVHAAVDGVDAPVDGMPFGGRAVALPDASSHANRVVGFDHLVAMSPHMDRTTASLEAAGLDHRRTRTFEAGGSTRRQAFFWLGSVILELVGDDADEGEGPATLWGLALTCDDLDAAAESLGDALGAITPAVQPGRRIATVRTKELGISVPIALMSPHPS
ncbi:MAG: glyoxalase [Actinomycetota bacterium]